MMFAVFSASRSAIREMWKRWKFLSLSVNLVPHPDEQVVERVLAEAERQPLDRFQLAPPFAVEPGQVVLVEHDGRREDHAPALGQRLFAHDLAVEIGHLARAPQVELHDAEVLAARSR